MTVAQITSAFIFSNSVQLQLCFGLMGALKSELHYTAQAKSQRLTAKIYKNP